MALLSIAARTKSENEDVPSNEVVFDLDSVDRQFIPALNLTGRKDLARDKFTV